MPCLRTDLSRQSVDVGRNLLWTIDRKTSPWIFRKIQRSYQKPQLWGIQEISRQRPLFGQTSCWVWRLEHLSTWNFAVEGKSGDQLWQDYGAQVFQSQQSVDHFSRIQAEVFLIRVRWWWLFNAKKGSSCRQTINNSKRDSCLSWRFSHARMTLC